MVTVCAVLENCVTPQTVYVIKAIIVLCFVVISLCLMAVLFDVVVFANRCMKAVRHHAIFSILAGAFHITDCFPQSYQMFLILLELILSLFYIHVYPVLNMPE